MSVGPAPVIDGKAPYERIGEAFSHYSGGFGEGGYSPRGRERSCYKVGGIGVGGEYVS